MPKAIDGTETVRVAGQEVELIKQFHPAEAIRDPDTKEYVDVFEHWTYGYKFNLDSDRKRQYGGYWRFKSEPVESDKDFLLQYAAQVIEELKDGREVVERLQEGVAPAGEDKE